VFRGFLGQDRIQVHAVVNALMKLRVLKMLEFLDLLKGYQPFKKTVLFRVCWLCW
jgi:hypothetical protein